ncbi:MAG: Chemotaxis protein methyltransferase CheR [Labilithrix sp.]|nr:Chemotaxis protein methyltransferase CheR [Labilithrix sp.]
MLQVLPPQLFAILSGLVEDRLGLHYGPEDVGLFSDKIIARAGEAGFESLLDYYYFLRYDPGGAVEMGLLADALVVGETYFFRELPTLRAAVSHVLSPAIERRGRARVWSAACATGEEPFSLAMLLVEAGLASRCEIVATDLSARSIARARQGVYGARSLRSLPPAGLPPGWTPGLEAVVAESLLRTDAGATVAPSIASIVTFHQSNLLDAAASAALGKFDLVLCRNVLIYFADATVMRTVAVLAAALEDAGSLLVGASESLLRFGTMLHCTERDGAFFYSRKVGA